MGKPGIKSCLLVERELLLVPVLVVIIRAIVLNSENDPDRATIGLVSWYVQLPVIYDRLSLQGLCYYGTTEGITGYGAGVLRTGTRSTGILYSELRTSFFCKNH
jgi:hypothetical protein